MSEMLAHFRSKTPFIDLGLCRTVFARMRHASAVSLSGLGSRSSRATARVAFARCARLLYLSLLVRHADALPQRRVNQRAAMPAVPSAAAVFSRP